jgi:ribosomal protein L14E/L6E/L27E
MLPYKTEQWQTQMSKDKKLIPGDIIWIHGGKYAGHRGVVVKLTRMMVYVQLGDGLENIRVWQCNVKKVEPSPDRTGGSSQVTGRNDEAAMKQLQEELKSVREQLEHVTDLLKKLTMDKSKENGISK